MNLDRKIESYYKVFDSQGFDLVDGFENSYPSYKKCFVIKIENGFILFTGFMDNSVDFLVFDRKKNLISMIDGINYIVPIENFNSFVVKAKTEEYSVTYSK